MTDRLEALFARRSIRRYTTNPIPRDLLVSLIDAAVWSPSAHNRQPARFALSDSAAGKERLAVAMGEQLRRDLTADGVPEAVIAADTGRSYNRITGAAALVVLCLTMQDMDIYPDDRRCTNEYLMAVQSTAMAGQNLLLAAHHAGLGACWMCAPLFCPDVVRAAFDLPDDWQPQALITIGWPDEIKLRSRRPSEKSILWR